MCDSMISKEIRDILSITLSYTKGYNKKGALIDFPILTQEQYQKKWENLAHFFIIDRPKNLENRKNEHLLHIYTSRFNEKIYILYPGKESTEEWVKQKAREGIKVRKNPYDFRPELYLPKSPFEEFTRVAPPLANIAIAHTLKEYSKEIGNSRLQILASILINMAFMANLYKLCCVGHRYQSNIPSNLDYNNLKQIKPHTLVCWYLTFNNHIIEELSRWPHVNLYQINNKNEPIKTSYEVSIEGLLYYLELLAQQEDCKYAFLKTPYLAHGRINCLLTFVNIIYNYHDENKFRWILSNFKKGVAPFSHTSFFEATDGIITVDDSSILYDYTNLDHHIKRY